MRGRRQCKGVILILSLGLRGYSNPLARLVLKLGWSLEFQVSNICINILESYHTHTVHNILLICYVNYTVVDSTAGSLNLQYQCSKCSIS